MSIKSICTMPPSNMSGLKDAAISRVRYPVQTIGETSKLSLSSLEQTSTRQEMGDFISVQKTLVGSSFQYNHGRHSLHPREVHLVHNAQVVLFYIS